MKSALDLVGQFFLKRCWRDMSEVGDKKFSGRDLPWFGTYTKKITHILYKKSVKMTSNSKWNIQKI